MNIRRGGMCVFAAVIGLLLASPSYGGKPDIFREIVPFDMLVVDCGSFEVWTSGWEKDTYKTWFDASGNAVRLQWSLKILEAKYYNSEEPDKFVTQGQNGVGENVTFNFDLTTGDMHNSGLGFRLTIPGIGHVLLNAGTWFWDESEGALVHHGPDFVLAEGETGLALCEALE